MRTGLALLFVTVCASAGAVDISNSYRSPRNPERRVRQATRLIILHTTEAPARSSLNKLSDRGEAHFCVTENGGIYRIVDRDREAFHAGRSMWNGQEDVDKFSIGIECVGYHNKAMPTVQLAAIRNLVKELQAMYRLPDECVIAHSHVAYGAPNRWQRCRHRGRKRCGMLFAMPSVRRILGLKAKPARDPDARRLAVGDEYLRKVLYANVDTMAGTYRNGAVVAEASSGGSWFSGLFGGSKSDQKGAERKPQAKGAAVAKKAPAKRAASPPAKATKAKGSASAPTSIAMLKSGGWRLMGCVSKNNPAVKIAGKKWNDANTYYTIRDKVISGCKMDDSRIERGMGVWMRK